MYEARNAEYIWIYESIVIVLFLRPKIHKIVTCFLAFDVENLNFYSQHVLPWNIIYGVLWQNLYIVPGLGGTQNNCRFVEPNPLF